MSFSLSPTSPWIDASSAAASTNSRNSSGTNACRLRLPVLVVTLELGIRAVSVPSSTDGNRPGGFFGGRPRLFVDVGVGGMLASDCASTSSFFDVRARLGVLFIGVAARRFVPVFGIGVPFDFLGLPLFRGVFGGLSTVMLSSSIDFRSGTVVVVAVSRGLLIGLMEGLNNLRLGLAPSSVSTVTRSFLGDELSPTSSEKVCLRGEGLRPTDPKRWESWESWLRVMRWEEGMNMSEVAASVRGSGEDISSSRVAIVATTRWVRGETRGAMRWWR